MRVWALRLAETLLLFGALAFVLPPLPSNEVQSVELLPGAAISFALFLGSRLLRWRRLWAIALLETAAFAAFLLVSNAVFNHLINLA